MQRWANLATAGPEAGNRPENLEHPEQTPANPEAKRPQRLTTRSPPGPPPAENRQLPTPEAGDLQNQTRPGALRGRCGPGLEAAAVQAAEAERDGGPGAAAQEAAGGADSAEDAAGLEPDNEEP